MIIACKSEVLAMEEIIDALGEPINQSEHFAQRFDTFEDHLRPDASSEKIAPRVRQTQ